jgi:hypothetical protein
VEGCREPFLKIVPRPPSLPDWWTQITFENDKQEQATAKANAGILRCAQNDKRGQDKYRGPFNAFGMTAVLSYLTG